MEAASDAIQFYSRMKCVLCCAAMVHIKLCFVFCIFVAQQCFKSNCIGGMSIPAVPVLNVAPVGGLALHCRCPEPCSINEVIIYDLK